MNTAETEHLRHVMDVCTDQAEALALSIIRFLAAGYSTGDVACWDAAYSGAEHLLGAEPGGRFVASLTSLVRALRAERIEGWMFMPVTCCRVTKDEQAIMSLVTLARSGDPKSVSEAAAHLAKRAEAPMTEAAAHGLAAMIDDIAAVLPTLASSHPRATNSIH